MNKKGTPGARIVNFGAFTAHEKRTSRTEVSFNDNVLSDPPPVLMGTATRSPVADLSDKTRALFVIGAGNVGKTTWLRWVIEQASSDVALASIDPGRSTLADHFPDCMTPGTMNPVDWLGMVLSAAMPGKETARESVKRPDLAIDIGAGNRTLYDLLGTLGGGREVTAMMEDHGLAPVLVVVLGTREDDLAPWAVLDQLDFRPTATLLVPNLGRMHLSTNVEQAFALVREHSLYRSAIERGAVEVFMPRNYAAGICDTLRGVSFADAELRLPMLLDRMRLTAWRKAMELSFGPVRSWLP